LEFSGACERVEVMFLETCVRGWGSGVLRVWESVGSVGGRWCDTTALLRAYRSDLVADCQQGMMMVMMIKTRK